MEIRRATIDDLIAIRADQQAFWGEHDVAALHHPLLVHDFGETAFVLTGEDDGVVAFLFGMLTPRRVGYCHLIAVREGHRRHGCARRLYERFEEAARARGAISLKAMTRPVNRVSIDFHRSLGFAVRDAPGYVGPGETRVVFEKQLHGLSAPAATVRLDSAADLRPIALADTGALHRAIEDNRAHLARYLPWAGENAEHTLAFVERCVRDMRAGEVLPMLIVRGGHVVGMATMRDSRANRSATIGYWLVEAEQGRGTMTQAVRELLMEAFDRRGTERVEIHVAAGNARSRAIPERLGFTVEGTLRRAHRLDGQVHDEVLYSLLTGEWHGGMSN